MITFESLGGTLVLYNKSVESQTAWLLPGNQTCSLVPAVLTPSLQGRGGGWGCGEVWYLVLGVSKEQIAVSIKAQLKLHCGPLARVRLEWGPILSKGAGSAAVPAAVRASQPGCLEGSRRRRCESLAGRGARLSGVPGPPPPRAAPVSAVSRAGLGNWCVQLPCPPPGQGQVRAWRGPARPGAMGRPSLPAPGEAAKRKFVSRVPEQCRSPEDSVSF